MTELPAGWSLVPLRDIVAPTRPRHSPSLNPDLPFIGMEHVEAYTMRLLGTVPARTMKSSAVHFQSGDVLYGRLRPYLNKVHRPTFEGLCSAEFIVFPESDTIASSFLQYFINSASFVRFASHLNTGDRPRIDFDQLADYKVPLPPLSEQRRIVTAIEEHLSRLDAAVAGLKRVQEMIPRYRAALLRAACEGRLANSGKNGTGAELLSALLKERAAKVTTSPIAPDEADPPYRPANWTVASVDQLTVRITSGSRDWSPYYGRGSGTLLMAQNIRPGRLDLSFRQAVDPPSGDSAIERSQVQENDILVTIVGANTGHVCRVPQPLPQHYVCQSVALMRPVRSELGRFLEIYLTAQENGQRQYRRYIYGQGRPHLSFEQLRMMPVPLPPLDVQKTIAQEVEQRLSVVTALEQGIDTALAHAAGLRQSILQRAFEGKLVPQDPNDEPASVLLERIRAARAGEKSKPATGVRKPRRESRAGSPRSARS